MDPRGKWFLRSKSYYSFGTSLHSALQKFHDSGQTGVSTVDQVVAQLEENWVSAGYATPEEAAEALAEGREIVQQYVEEHIARGPTTNTLFVEKQLRLDLESFVLIGRIDRVDEHPDGTLEIIDYKSGRDATDEEELRSDIAMNVYQLLLRSKMPERRVLSTIIALRSQGRTTIDPESAALTSFQDDIMTIGNEILNRDFDSVLPVVKDICPACDFLELCSRDSDFHEELSSLGEKTSTSTPAE